MPSTILRSLAAVAAGAALTLGSAGLAFADDHQPLKVWVCKYVGTPGDDERLQTGQNPISVSENAVSGAEVGDYFNDAQGRSYVLAVDDGGPEPSVDECPPADVPTPTPTMTATPTPTMTATPTPTMTATHTPTMTKPVTGPVVETDRPAGGDSSQLGLFAGAAALLAAASALALNRRRQSADH
ncbi:MAG: hypothetical protein ABR500_13780 [Dermatophilaceae bacterium]